jgi:hypothetical protein
MCGDDQIVEVCNCCRVVTECLREVGLGGVTMEQS